jgi:PTH1 family peptidyl-tRNA hydrolase
MKLIVGLGNPGDTYAATRHNIGFMAVDQFLKDFAPVDKTRWKVSKKYTAEVFIGEWQRTSPRHTGVAPQSTVEKFILVKPQTFMNVSGTAVGALADFYQLDSKDIWVLYDDADLPSGSLRIRQGGASAGHNGVMSIIERLGTDAFWRFRLGIGRPNGHGNLEGYVLEPFERGENRKVGQLLKHASKALQHALEEDPQSAVVRYNTK